MVDSRRSWEGVAVSCPSEDCRGVRPEQRELTLEEIALIPKAEWIVGATLCASCGCVYTRDVRGHATIRGWLDNKVAGPGWRAAPNL